MMITRWQICAVSAFTLCALVPAVPAASAGSDHDYANQTNYGNPADTLIRKPPAGYRVYFLETVARHGARTMTSDSREQDVLDLVRRADGKNALTDIGRSLGKDIRRFQAAERNVGYGELTSRGRREMAGIGRRTGDNYGAFFARIRKDKDKIATLTSDVTRTKQSASSLRGGLRNALSFNLDSLLAGPDEAGMLRFSNGSSSAGQAVIAKVRSRSYIRSHAQHVLTTSFKKSFVKTIDNPIGAALDIYLLYATAPGLSRESNVTFNRYMPRADRSAMSYATDVRTFYRYGPGVKGESNTFNDARPLLKDFFSRLDRRIDGGSTAAVFRVAHGETIMPFAALIKAPGSGEQTPKGKVFTRKTNAWRGSVAGRLGGNIEWTAVRNADRKVLVTMRYNEKPVRFHGGCSAYKKGSYFYRVAELKRCLG